MTTINEDLGQISTKVFNEKSYNGIDVSVLKSGLQKYCRRGEFEKGLWCLVELDLFSLAEKSDDKKVATVGKRIRTNMINRLIVMMSEEISIANWLLPIEIKQFYEAWLVKKQVNEKMARWSLVNMYKLILESKKIRIISDYRSLYLLPPYYVDDKYMSILREKHKELLKKYGLYDKVYCQFDFDTGKDLEGNIGELLKNCDERIFVLLLKNFSSKESEIAIITVVWKALINFFDDGIKENELKINVIKSLKYFYYTMKHKEKYIYLYHAILFVIKRNEINWNMKKSEIVVTNEELDRVDKLYKINLSGKNIELDDFIFDIHTKNKVNIKDGRTMFAIEGSKVVNEDKNLLNEDYRKVYIELKKIIDQTDFAKLLKQNQMQNYIQSEDDNNQLLKLLEDYDTRINVREINEIGFLDKLPHGQKLTSKNKKIVYVDREIVIKGPYLMEEKSFINNIKFTKALEYLEDELKLPEEYRSSLPWREIWKYKNAYYLICDNVGNFDAMKYEIVSSKLEENVPVIVRESYVQRYSEIEDNEIKNEKYKIAVLQHLYLRFLLGIGDSGTHNILVRRDKDKSKRLIVGNDLEEIRLNKNPKNVYECLFRKVFKKHEKLYENYLKKMRIIFSLSDEIKKKLERIGMDVKEIEDNIQIWIKFNNISISIPTSISTSSIYIDFKKLTNRG